MGGDRDKKGEKMKVTALVAGGIVGFLAAGAQAFFHITPPPAYGICIACHMRDFVNWVITHVYPLYGSTAASMPVMPVAGVSRFFPLLTVVGVLLGAAFAAVYHKEFRWRTMNLSWQKPIAEFFWGVLVMISALIVGGCPIRTALKISYMDITAMVVLVMVFVGIVAACSLIKRMN